MSWSRAAWPWQRWTEYDHQRVSDALALTVDGRSRQEHLFTLR